MGLWLLAVIVCLLSVVSGCSSSPANSPKKRSLPEDVKVGDTDALTKDDSGTKKEVKQPSYMIDRATASLLLKEGLFEPLKRLEGGMSDGQPFPEEPAMSVPEVERFIVDFFAKAMKAKAFSPGRDFHVVISDSKDVINMSMTTQTIYITHSNFEYAKDSTSWLQVLCHEAAHSARNHMYKNPDQGMSKLANDPTLSSVLNDFYYATYDQRRAVYVHSERAVDELMRFWGPALRELEIANKKVEAEADAVGMAICAHLGLEPVKYREAHGVFSTFVEEFYEKVENKGPPPLRDGEELPMSEDDLSAFLLAEFLVLRDTHPTNAERMLQHENLTPVFNKIKPELPMMLQEWVAGLKSATENAGYADFALKQGKKVSAQHDHRRCGLDIGRSEVLRKSLAERFRNLEKRVRD